MPCQLAKISIHSVGSLHSGDGFPGCAEAFKCNSISFVTLRIIPCKLWSLSESPHCVLKCFPLAIWSFTFCMIFDPFGVNICSG